MKKAWKMFAAAGTLAALCAVQAKAAIVTVEFAIPVEEVWTEFYMMGQSDFQSVNTATLNGITASVGDTLAGRITYDDAVPLRDGYFATVDVSMRLPDGTTFEPAPDAMSVGSRSDGNYVYFNTTWAYASSAGPVYTTIQYDFSSPTGHLTPGMPPRASDWQYFSGTEGINLMLGVNGVTTAPGYETEYSQWIYVTGGISSPHVVSAVPEPATAGMLLAGLALVGAAAARRRG